MNKLSIRPRVDTGGNFFSTECFPKRSTQSGKRVKEKWTQVQFKIEGESTTRDLQSIMGICKRERLLKSWSKHFLSVYSPPSTMAGTKDGNIVLPSTKVQPNTGSKRPHSKWLHIMNVKFSDGGSHNAQGSNKKNDRCLSTHL